MGRKANSARTTKETDIDVSVDIDGSGAVKVDLEPAFLGHMIEAFGCHGMFDLEITASGDVEVDQHHLAEDLGLVLGTAVSKALGERRGIYRSGFYLYPMEDALSAVVVDLSGRPYCNYDVEFNHRFVGGFDTDVLEDFFYGLSVGLKANVTVKMHCGRSDHHIVESIFKALGKSLRMACTLDKRLGDKFPSTKEVLDHG